MEINNHTAHEIYKWATSLLFGLLVFVGIHVWDKNERQDVAIQDFRVEVARDYVAKKDFERFEDKLDTKLDQIESNIVKIIKESR
tara:strand:- start:34606 stop:34860 length:255 start_codon:yes stop_codon:yes gene_type:complete